MKHVHFYILAFIVIGMILRLYQLGQVPVGLYWDETAMLVDAKSVSQSGQDMHGLPWYQTIFPSYGDYKLPVYIWLASLSVKLFGVSAITLRLPSAVAGLGTLAVGFLLARQLAFFLAKKDEIKEWTWLTTLVIALSPWAILFARTGFEGHLAQFLVALSVLILLTHRQRWWGPAASAIIGALAVYTYFSVRFVWPVVFGLFSLLLLLPEQWSKEKRVTPAFMLSVIKGLVVPLAIFALLLVPQTKSPWYQASTVFRYSTDSVLNAYDYPMASNIMREAAGNTRLDRVFFHRTGLLGKELLKNYADHLSLSYLFLDGDSNLRHGTGYHGLFLFVWLPAFILGLYSLFRRRWTVATVLVGWWLIALLPASVPENTPHALRSLNALLPLSLLIGWGAGELINWLMKQKAIGRWALFAAGIILAFSVFGFARYYFIHYPVISAPEWQDGYAEVAQKLLSARQGKEPIYIATIDDKFYLWVMASDPYSARDFHDWKSQNFQFHQFDEWHFNQVVPNPGVGQSILVASKPDFVENLRKQPQLQVDSLAEVHDRYQAQTFVVVRVRGL